MNGAIASWMSVIIALIGSVIIPIYYKESGKVNEAKKEMIEMIIEHVVKGNRLNEEALKTIIGKVSFSHNISQERIKSGLKLRLLRVLDQLEDREDIPLNGRADILMMSLKLPRSKTVYDYFVIFSLIATIIAAIFGIAVNLFINPLSLNEYSSILFSASLGITIGFLKDYIRK